MSSPQKKKNSACVCFRFFFTYFNSNINLKNKNSNIFTAIVKRQVHKQKQSQLATSSKQSTYETFELFSPT